LRSEITEVASVLVLNSHSLRFSKLKTWNGTAPVTLLFPF
jgi:hypothetical protein